MNTNIVKKITSYFTLSIFTFVMSIGQVHAAAAPVFVGLAISPISQTVSAGQTVSYSIMASNDQPTYAMQFSVNYDANLLTLNNVVPGSGISSWSMEKNTNQAGVIKLGFYNTNPLGLTNNPQQVAFITFTVKSTIPTSYNPKIEIAPTVNNDQTIPVMFGIDGFNEADLASSQITNATVAVSKPNVAPSVSLTGPLTAVTLPSNVNITGTASDSDGIVSKVEIFSGAARLGNATISGSSYSFTWAAAAGIYSLTAKATDNSGAVTTSSALSVTVNSKPNAIPVATTQSVTTDEDTTKSITLAGTDADGDTLTYTLLTQPIHGVLSGTVPNLTYTPTANYNGGDSFTFKVNDGKSDSASTSVSLVVSAANDAPTVSGQNLSTPQDTAKAITLAASDIDGNSLTYNIVVSPTNGSLSGTAPNLTYTPANGYRGSDSFTFKVNDGTADSAIATINMTMTAVNHTPSATVQSLTTTEDTAKTITLAGADSDNDVLTYIIVNKPTHGALSGTAPNLIYTPTANYNGSDSFTFKVNDGNVDSAVAEINMGITAVNDIPTATSQVVSTSEDTAKTIVLAGSDVDGDSLTYSIVSGPAHGSLSGTVPNLAYTPGANYSGSDSFIFKVNDGKEDSAAATVSLNISDVNHAPSATAQSVSATEDTVKAITLAGIDSDNDALTYIIVNQPAHGALSGTAPNLTYTPATNYNGGDSFTFKVSDGFIQSATATVSVSITAVNDDPTATAQSTNIFEDTAKSIILVGNDTDGDGLTYTVLTQPVHGVLNGTAPNLIYTPAANYNGSDSFTFKVNDGKVDSAVATVNMSITVINDVPVATAQSVTTAEDSPKAITLAGTDSDNDTLSYIVINQPAHGALSGTAPNLTYTPDADYHGNDSFTFKVNDSKIDSAVATVSLKVTPTNDNPKAAFKMDKSSGIVPLLINFSAEDSMDPDSTETDKDIVSYSWNLGDGSSKTGMKVSHSYSNEGSYTATLTVTDKEGVTDIISKTITVNPIPNVLPMAVLKSNVLEGTIPFNVTFNGQDSSDPDGSIVAYHWNFGDGATSKEMNPSYTYNTEGTYVATLVVTDNKGEKHSTSKVIKANPKVTVKLKLF